MEKGQDREIINKMEMQGLLPTQNNIGYFTNGINSIKNYQPLCVPNNAQPTSNYIYQAEIGPTNSLNTTPKTPKENMQLTKNISNSFSSEKQKTKSYLDLLVNSVNNLFKEGKITMKFLEEKSEPKNDKLNQTEEKQNHSQEYTKYTNKKENYYYENIHGINGKHSLENEKCCENQFCKYVFKSNKEKIRVKINGAKTLEKILCENCCSAVENRQFCYYCGTIYRETLCDKAVWVECHYCDKWDHFDCELHKGKRYSSEKELSDDKHYMCPDCTNKRTEQKISDDELKKRLINKKRKSDLLDEQRNKKNKYKDLRNLKSEKFSELLTDVMQIEAIKSSNGGS